MNSIQLRDMQSSIDIVTTEEMAALAFSAVGCITSVRTLKIPNWLTFPAAFTAFLISFLHNDPVSPIEGWLLVIFLAILLQKKSDVPFGATKLLGAIGAALGPKYGSIELGIFYIIYFVFGLTFARGATDGIDNSKRRVPLGPLILLATILTFCARRISWEKLRFAF